MKENHEVETEDVKSKKTKRKRNKKSKRSIFITVAVAVFAVYVVTVFISQQIQISGKKDELTSITQELQVQNMKNNEIKKSLELNETENSEYIDRLARIGLDFVKSSERVFVNVAGN